MIRLIARRDFLDLRRDGRLYWAGAIVLLLLFSALLLGVSHARAVQAEHEAGDRADYEEWLAQGTKNPHAAAHHGLYVYKPEPTLALVDPGLNPYLGSTLWLEAHKQNDFQFRPAQDATGLQRFGGFSAAWVLQIFMPLLIIVLGFDAFAGEREVGTLRQVMCEGVSPRTLLWGKCLCLAGSVSLLLIPAALVMLAAVGFNADSAVRIDILIRFAWITVGYALYLGIFLFLVLTVSARVSSPRIALLALLAIWIVNCMVAPRATSDLTSLLNPTPTRFEFMTALKADTRKTTEKVLTESFKVKTYGELPTTEFGAEMVIEEELNHAIFAQHYGRLWAHFASQQQVLEVSGLLAPMLAVRAFSMGLAGTDLAHHQDFVVAAEDQRMVMVRLMNADLVKNAGDQAYNYRVGPALWTTVPPMHYRAPSWRWALARNGHSLLILVIGFAGTFLLALHAVHRLRVD